MTLLSIFLAGTACTTNSWLQNPHSTPSPVFTESVQEQYTKALARWRGRNIKSYQITVEVFSSRLSPPCQMRAVLTVRNDELAAITNLQTPVPVEAPDGRLLDNPECNDYQQYLVANQFALLNKLLRGEITEKPYAVKFDASYGYISHLSFGVGETMRDASFSDFQAK